VFKDQLVLIVLRRDDVAEPAMHRMQLRKVDRKIQHRMVVIENRDGERFAKQNRRHQQRRQSNRACQQKNLQPGAAPSRHALVFCMQLAHFLQKYIEREAEAALINARDEALEVVSLRQREDDGVINRGRSSFDQRDAASGICCCAGDRSREVRQ